MKALRVAALVFATLAVGAASACVVENNPPPPLPPVALRPPVIAPIADAAPRVVVAEAEGGAEAAGPGNAGSGAVAPPSGPFLACAVDADCVAVKKNGCCNNGYKEAVNASSVAAYEASFVCPDPHPICPMFRIRDDRVPECNKTTHECQLVKR